MKIQLLLRDLNRVYTLQQIADMCGFASKGHVHDVIHGNQETVRFELGMSILDAHAAFVRQQNRARKRK